MALFLNTSNAIDYKVTNPKVLPTNVDDAAVTVSIFDKDDVLLAGESWPVVLPFVSGSLGEYSKTFDPFTNLIKGDLYSIVINVVGSDSLKDECESKHRAITKICV